MLILSGEMVLENLLSTLLVRVSVSVSVSLSLSLSLSPTPLYLGISDHRRLRLPKRLAGSNDDGRFSVFPHHLFSHKHIFD